MSRRGQTRRAPEDEADDIEEDEDELEENDDVEEEEEEDGDDDDAENMNFEQAASQQLQQQQQEHAQQSQTQARFSSQPQAPHQQQQQQQQQQGPQQPPPTLYYPEDPYPTMTAYDHKDLVRAAKSHYIRFGWQIITSSVRRKPNGALHRIDFRCNRGSHRPSRSKGLRNKKSKKTGCLWRGELMRFGDAWQFVPGQIAHNHPPLPSAQGLTREEEKNAKKKKSTRLRLRQLVPKVFLGDWPTGPKNSLTDVPGVLVSTQSLHHQSSVNTGVTVILPRKNWYTEGCYANFSRFNGAGELTGSHWLAESGILSSPIVLTNTMSVGDAYRGVFQYAIKHHSTADGELSAFMVPVVGETFDGYLNDITKMAVQAADVTRGIDMATDEAVDEGNTGGGTGMVCHHWKGGTGSASRVVPGINANQEATPYTVGVLVQSNYGKSTHLRMAGVPVGRIMAEQLQPLYQDREAEIRDEVLLQRQLRGMPDDSDHTRRQKQMSPQERAFADAGRWAEQMQHNMSTQDQQGPGTRSLRFRAQPVKPPPPLPVNQQTQQAGQQLGQRLAPAPGQAQPRPSPQITMQSHQPVPPQGQAAMGQGQALSPDQARLRAQAEALAQEQARHDHQQAWRGYFNQQAARAEGTYQYQHMPGVVRHPNPVQNNSPASLQPTQGSAQQTQPGSQPRPSFQSQTQAAQRPQPPQPPHAPQQAGSAQQTGPAHGQQHSQQQQGQLPAAPPQPTAEEQAQAARTQREDQVSRERWQQNLAAYKEHKDGSIIVVIATDAPLNPTQCERLAKRATVGMSRVGGYGSNASGDIFVAFSTANKVPVEKLNLDGGMPDVDPYRPKARGTEDLDNATINGLFEAAADATEESIYNSMCMAETMEGFLNRRVEALPLRRLKEILETGA